MRPLPGLENLRAEAHAAAESAHAARADGGVQRVPAQGTEFPKHAIGAALLVQRSDGSYLECTVLSYDAERSAYKVQLEDGSGVRKMAAEKMLRPRTGGRPAHVARGGVKLADA